MALAYHLPPEKRYGFPKSNVRFVRCGLNVQLVPNIGVFPFIQTSPALQELRERQTTAIGRQKLRERVSVEHSLAHIGQWQGKQARYLGLCKNLFALRRMAVVHNLHVWARMFAQNQQISA